jgi:hypothetical protein
MTSNLRDAIRIEDKPRMRSREGQAQVRNELHGGSDDSVTDLLGSGADNLVVAMCEF